MSQGLEPLDLWQRALPLGTNRKTDESSVFSSMTGQGQHQTNYFVRGLQVFADRRGLVGGWEYPEICGSITSCEILDSPSFLLAHFIQLPNTPSFLALFFFKTAFSILVFFYPFLHFLPPSTLPSTPPHQIPLPVWEHHIPTSSAFLPTCLSHTSSGLFTQDFVHSHPSFFLHSFLSCFLSVLLPRTTLTTCLRAILSQPHLLLQSPSLQPCLLTCSLRIKQSLLQLHLPPAWDRSGTQSLPQLQSHADIPTITSHQLVHLLLPHVYSAQLQTLPRR